MLFSFKRSIFVLICSIVVFAIGLYTIISDGIPEIQEYKFYQNTEPVYGIVNNIKIDWKNSEAEYNFYVSYITRDGEVYTNIRAKYINVVEKKCKIGDKVVVFYEKDTPIRIGVGTYIFWDLILFIGLPLILMIWQLVEMIKKCKRIKSAVFLINNGLKGFAEIKCVVCHGHGKYRKYIIYYVVTHPITRECIHNVEKLHAIDGGAKFSIHQYFTAYIHPNNPKVYCIKF